MGVGINLIKLKYLNLVCYNCSKSKKDQKNIQIFYCIQYMKLFSKDFLYQHNYISVSEIPLDEIKKFFENNINTISAQVLHIYTKNPYLNIFYLDENNKKGNKENDEIIINQIAFPKDINRITYFNDLYKSFLKNPKKKIMNNIF